MVLSAINKAIQDGVTYVVSDTEGYVRWVEKESGEVFPVEDIFQFLSPEFEISLIGTGDQSLEQSANDVLTEIFDNYYPSHGGLIGKNELIPPSEIFPRFSFLLKNKNDPDFVIDLTLPEPFSGKFNKQIPLPSSEEQQVLIGLFSPHISPENLGLPSIEVGLSSYPMGSLLFLCGGFHIYIGENWYWVVPNDDPGHKVALLEKLAERPAKPTLPSKVVASTYLLQLLSKTGITWSAGTSPFDDYIKETENQFDLPEDTNEDLVD